MRSESERKILEMYRFGRRVIFDRQVSSQELLADHLNTLRVLETERRNLTQITKNAERDYIDMCKRQDDCSEAEKQHFNSQILKEYARYNQL